MPPTTRLLQVDADSAANALTCIRCRLTITYADDHARVVSDLLASHWADDHHLAVWRDAAAEARDRLWRHHPDLLQRLTAVSETTGGTPARPCGLSVRVAMGAALPDWSWPDNKDSWPYGTPSTWPIHLVMDGMVTVTCNGTVIVHRDRTMTCTELPCPQETGIGYWLNLHSAFMPCSTTLGEGCPICSAL